MDDLVVATYPRGLSVLAGESLLVRSVIENRGPGPASVPPTMRPSQFTYEIRGLRDKEIVYRASGAIRTRRRTSGLFTEDEETAETLSPLQKAEWREDLADMLNEALAPGKYAIMSSLDGFGLVSPRAFVTVLAPKVESLSSFVSERVLISVMAHRRRDGRVVLLQRESLRHRPSEGVFQPLRNLPSPGKATVAGSIDVAPAGNGRWLAWLQDNILTAIHAWGTSVSTDKPVQAEGELLDPGFQIGLGTALFGMVSLQNGETRLETFLANRTGLNRHWSAVLTPGTVKKVRWHYGSEGFLTVVWESGDTGMLMSRGFSADGTPSEDPVVLARRAVTAWGANPDGPLDVWIVLDTETGSLLGIWPRRASYKLKPLPGARLWSVCSCGSQGTWVVAADDNRIWVTEAQGGGVWRELARSADAQRLSTFEMRGGWAEWVEPGLGVRRARLQ